MSASFDDDDDLLDDEGEIVNGVAADKLIEAIEEIERLDDEIANLRSEKADTFAELKASGFEVKVIREILKRRKMDRESRETMDELVRLYSEAIGL